MLAPNCSFCLSQSQRNNLGRERERKGQEAVTLSWFPIMWGSGSIHEEP